jgi:hypothetical protein
MTKFLNKYVRKFHRWLALPFVVLIITLLLTRDTSAGFAAQRAQQILMLIMALSGLYLFVLPWWTKWRRRERSKA